MLRLPLSRSSMRGNTRPLAAALLVLAVVAGAGYAVERWVLGSSTPSVSSRPVVVLNSESATKWVALLHSAGVSARVGTLGDALARPRFVIPAQAYLSESERSRVRARVAGGAHALVVDPDT